MKIIGINGSPRPNGNTKAALDLMGEVFAQEGIEFEVLHIGSSPAPCTGCFRCFKAKECTLPDDGLNAIYQKMLDADGFVFGAPVYFSSIASGMRCFLDRMGCIAMNTGHPFRFKVAAPLVVARRAGSVASLDQIIHYINYSQMILPGSTYWPLVYGQKPGEVAQDPEGVQTVQVLAQNMAYVLKTMAVGREQIPVPELPRKAYTNFVR